MPYRNNTCRRPFIADRDRLTDTTATAAILNDGRCPRLVAGRDSAGIELSPTLWLTMPVLSIKRYGTNFYGLTFSPGHFKDKRHLAVFLVRKQKTARCNSDVRGRGGRKA